MQTKYLLLASLLVAVPLGATPLVERVATPNGGLVPDAEVDAVGNIHLACVTGDNVFYTKSTDDGKTFSTPLRVNSEAGSAHPAGMFRGPDLAVAGNGQVHVIWYNNAYQRKLPKDQWGVMYSHLNAGRTAFLPARNLSRKPGDNYSLAAGPGGELAVFWMAGGLFLNTSLDGGEKFSDPLAVAVADTCECCASRAFFSGDGALHCAYRDKAGDQRDMYLLTRPRSRPGFEKEKISVTPWEIKGCPMTGTFLSGAKNGLVIAWETKGQVFYVRCDQNGRKTTVREIAVPGRGGKWPVALAAPDGSVLVSWKKGAATEWQMFGADDRPAGELKSVPGKSPHRHAGVVTRTGNFLLID